MRTKSSRQLGRFLPRESSQRDSFIFHPSVMYGFINFRQRQEQKDSHLQSSFCPPRRVLILPVIMWKLSCFGGREGLEGDSGRGPCPDLGGWGFNMTLQYFPWGLPQMALVNIHSSLKLGFGWLTNYVSYCIFLFVQNGDRKFVQQEAINQRDEMTKKSLP